MARRPMLCRAADPILQQLTDACNRRGVTADEIGMFTAASLHSFREWREGRADPSLSRLRSVAEYLGYDLVLQKRRK